MKKIIRKIVPVLLAITLTFTVASYNEASAKEYTCTSPKLQQLIDEWSGVYWTGSFRSATTCKGFADMMFNELYGNGGVGAYNSGAYSYYVPTPRAATEIARLSSAGYQDFYNIMHKAASGDYIQWATAYSQHSSIFLSCDENGFYVFDSNYVEPYLCTVHYITYDYISSVTYGVSLYRSTSSEAPVEKKVEKKKVEKVLDQIIIENPDSTPDARRELLKAFGNKMFYFLDVLVPEEYNLYMISERGKNKYYVDIPRDSRGCMNSCVMRRKPVSVLYEGSKALDIVIEERKEQI